MEQTVSQMQVGVDETIFFVSTDLVDLGQQAFDGGDAQTALSQRQGLGRIIQRVLKVGQLVPIGVSATDSVRKGELFGVAMQVGHKGPHLG